MSTQAVSPDACRKFITALREEQENVKEMTHEKIEASANPITQAIPDAGNTNAYTNNDVVEYFDAFQDTQAYKSMDNSVRDLIDGEMSAASCAGVNGIFETQVNEQDPNACNGIAFFNFAQGFTTHGTIDLKFAFRTPEVCPENFIRYGPAHVDGYFNSMKESFSGYGARVFEDNLTNLVILNGQANSSINSADGWSMTTQGWESPPKYRMSIAHLRKVRRIIERRRGLTPDGFLVVSMPRQDWIDACVQDALRQNPTGTVYQGNFFKSINDQAKSQDIGVYDNIKCIFDESPIRGYYKPAGVTGGKQTYNFTRVLPYKNEIKAGGGIGRADNYDYDEAFIKCEGGVYPMATLAFIVHPKSFKRWGLNKAPKKVGSPNVGTNFETVVIDGDAIKDNVFNDKFALAARHRFRFRADKPEWSGAIAYLHSPPRGYVNEVNLITGDVAPDEPSTPRPLPPYGPSADQENVCQTCYDGPASPDGTCNSVATGVLTMSPAGPVVTLEGETLRFRVSRAAGFDGAASVNYATANGTALAGTHYTNTNGTLNWVDGEDGDKFINVPILADVADTDITFTLTISGPVGSTISAGDNVATVTIQG